MTVIIKPIEEKREANCNNYTLCVVDTLENCLVPAQQTKLAKQITFHVFIFYAKHGTLFH